MRPLGKVKIDWNPDFAYAVGLITTDGNLSTDGRHINFTTKDFDLALTFKSCLKLQNKIGRKGRGGSKDKKYFVIQFGDKKFYNFLLSLGLMPAKSKKLQNLNIPEGYFADFLRGCIDGDGNINISKHPESQHLQLRLRLCSASPNFLKWIKNVITKNCGVKGGWIQKCRAQHTSVAELTFGKNDSIVVLRFIYYPGVKSYLNRKYVIANEILGTWRNWHTRSA
jgi:hypothetical protein